MEERLAMYFSGNLSIEEEKEVELWRDESENNLLEFYDYEQVWRIANEREVDSSKALNSIYDRIDAQGSEMKLSKSNKSNWSSYLKYAAVAVFFIGVAVAGKSFLAAEEVNFISAKENLEIIALPDGSVVTLSPNSKLTFPLEFDGELRSVSLEGKAFFDIQRDESKPFIVNTEQSKIRVLGTSFLVNTLTSNSTTEVLVKSGRVAVMNKEKEVEEIELVAGEIGVLSASSSKFNKSSIANYNYLAWKTKLIEFEKEELKTVVEVLKEVYGVNIEVSDANILNCQMSAKFDHQSIDSILEILSLTFSLELSKSSKKEYLLTGNGCFVTD